MSHRSLLFMYIDTISVQYKGKFVPVYNMKAYWKMEVYLHVFLTSVLDRVSGQLYTPTVLSSGEKNPHPH